MADKQLDATIAAAAFQKQWFANLRRRVFDERQPYALLQADVPFELFDLVDIPAVSNQWWAAMVAAKRQAPAYLDAMQTQAGAVGRMLAHGVIDGLVPPLWEVRPHEFPLVNSVLDHADGVIVHSHYVEDEVRAAGFARPVWRIPMPTWPVPTVERLETTGFRCSMATDGARPSRRSTWGLGIRSRNCLA